MIESDKKRDRLSARALSIDEAPTLAIASRANAMRRSGIDVVSFSTGEPDFKTPDEISQAGIDAINEGFTHYTDSNGIAELRDAVATKFREENGLHSTPETVLVSSGGKHSIFNVLSAIVDPGDEVIIPAPYWVSYPSIVSLLGGVPVILPTESRDRYRISNDQLRAALTERTRCVILNSPSNPTGVMYTRDELEAFAATILDSDSYILSDELYEKIIYGTIDHFSIGSMPSASERTITINGVSKAWAMTGWRIGFATGPADVMKAAGAIQSQTTSNASSISQRAALEALRNGAGSCETMRAIFEVRRGLMGEKLGAIPEIAAPIPDGAFYYFVDVSAYLGGEIEGSAQLAEYLLQEHHVAVVPGDAFGDPRGMRLSYACSQEDIVKGMDRITEGLSRLRR